MSGSPSIVVLSSTALPTDTLGSTKSKGNASSLYLFTFLATLCLLLFVSCSIVARSFVMRRRYQRRISEAIAAGRMLSPRVQGSRKRQFIEKPQFYDSHVAPGGVGWDSIMPVSAHVLSRVPLHPSPNARRSREIRTSVDIPVSRRPSQSERLLNRRPSLFSILSRSSDRRHTLTSNPDAESPEDKPHARNVQISVLVAMPKPPSPPQQPPPTTDDSSTDLSESREQEDLPDVVLGVTQISYTVKNSK